ncbi:hypothetical protein, partial [Klebsiella pneumoniae]|uniref:hypothetical protein n=1 Tax=Klebsiella pneumoniae TaxID=573 RepID=UPI001D0ED50B
GSWLRDAVPPTLLVDALLCVGGINPGDVLRMTFTSTQILFQFFINWDFYDGFYDGLISAYGLVSIITILA